MPEAELFEKIKNGDAQSYELIFRRYYNDLCNYACSLFKDMDRAEEVVQDVFVKFWEKRGSITIHSSLKAYLFRAVYNTGLNELEKMKKTESLSEENVQIAGDVHTSTGELKELEKRIEASLMELPEKCRMVFKLSRYRNLKYKEIAEVLNISVKTVENQMGKALGIMRQNLSEYLSLVLAFLFFRS